MNKISSKLMVLIICLLMGISMFTVNKEVALADNASVQATVQQYGVDKFSSWISSDSTLAGKADYTSISITDSNNIQRKYYYRKDDEQAILNKGKSLQGQSNIDDLDNLYNLSADTHTAADLTRGLEGPFRTFLGLLVTFITIFMTVFTAFDLCYIAFPTFRGKMNEAKENGTKGLTRTNSKGETKLNLITDDAQFAVVSTETAQTGQSAYVVYLKKRVISFVINAVLIFILLTGNINILTNIGVKLASGVLEAISNSF